MWPKQQSHCGTHQQLKVSRNPRQPKSPGHLPETPLSTHHLADGQHSWVLIYQNWTEFSRGLVVFLASCLEGKRKSVKRKKRKQILGYFFAIGLTFPYTISHLSTYNHLGAPHLNPTWCAWTWETGMLSPGLRSCSWLMAEGSFEPRTL